MKSDQRVLLRGGTIGAALKAATGGSVADFFGSNKESKPRASRKSNKKVVVVMAISAQPDMTQLVGAEI